MWFESDGGPVGRIALRSLLSDRRTGPLLAGGREEVGQGGQGVELGDGAGADRTAAASAGSTNGRADANAAAHAASPAAAAAAAAADACRRHRSWTDPSRELATMLRPGTRSCRALWPRRPSAARLCVCARALRPPRKLLHAFVRAFVRLLHARKNVRAPVCVRVCVRARVSGLCARARARSSPSARVCERAPVFGLVSSWNVFRDALMGANSTSRFWAAWPHVLLQPHNEGFGMGVPRGGSTAPTSSTPAALVSSRRPL